jgi:hypothetical protein
MEINAIPVSFALQALVPVHESAVQTSTTVPLVATIWTARQALGGQFDSLDARLRPLYTYLGILFGLRAVDGERHLLHGAPNNSLKWSSATNPAKIIAHSSLDTEITFVLSHLCSILGTDAEEEARSYHVANAQIIFGDCADALNVLGAFMERAEKIDLVKLTRDDAEARARVARLFVWQAQFTSLVKTNASERFAIGLGLVAEYNRLAKSELLATPFAAKIAQGYAHYWFMVCAREKAREVEACGTSVLDVDVLARLEQLYALVLLESDRAARFFASEPRALDFCTRTRREAQELYAKTRDRRFHVLVVLGGNEAILPVLTDEDAFAGALDIFDCKPAVSALTPKHVPLALNTAWCRIQTESLAWFQLQGGIEAVRQLDIGNVGITRRGGNLSSDVRAQLVLHVPAGCHSLLTRRDLALLLLGRLTERVEAARGRTTDALIQPVEIDDMCAEVKNVGQLLVTLLSEVRQ